MTLQQTLISRLTYCLYKHTTTQCQTCIKSDLKICVGVGLSFIILRSYSKPAVLNVLCNIANWNKVRTKNREFITRFTHVCVMCCPMSSLIHVELKRLIGKHNCFCFSCLFLFLLRFCWGSLEVVVTLVTFKRYLIIDDKSLPHKQRRAFTWLLIFKIKFSSQPPTR